MLTMRSTLARKQPLTTGGAIASGISNTGRELLTKVMGQIREKFDMPLATWCTRNGLDRFQTRNALLGANRSPRAIASARKAMRAAGLTEGD